MDKKLGIKNNHIILLILTTIILVLIILVLIQNREIKKLQKVNSNFYNAAVMPSEKHPDNFYSGKNNIADADNECLERIKKLELKIANMQSWQDYLEKTIEKDNNEKTEREESINQALKSSLTSQMEIFAEEYNIPENKKTEVIELLFEMDLETRKISTDSKNTAEIQQERENIKSRYENMIAELLSVEDYNAFKEFQDKKQDRSFVKNATDHPISGKIELDKQQEKNLVTAIYHKRLEIEEAEDLKTLRIEKNLIKKGGLIKRLRAEEKLLDGYIESAKYILSEPQIKTFQNYIEVRRSILKMTEKQIAIMSESENQDDEKADE